MLKSSLGTSQGEDLLQEDNSLLVNASRRSSTTELESTVLDIMLELNEVFYSYSLDLNFVRAEACLTSSGRLFQILGA